MDYKNSEAPLSTVTYNREEIEKETDNLATEKLTI